MKNSILVPLDDSARARAVLDYLISLPLCRDDLEITLIHVFKQPSGSEELMGKKFIEEEPQRFLAVLQKAKDKLVEKGFNPDKVKLSLVTELYPTVSDGILDQLGKGDFDMAVIGRRKMSKAEEFVLGDVGIKLVRAVEKGSILVVKCP